MKQTRRLGPEFWRIRLEPVTVESLAAHVALTGTATLADDSQCFYILEVRRRVLFWGYWSAAISTLNRSDAGSWATHFRIALPAPPTWAAKP